ncbi:hypothetical protein KUV85_06790 [Nocardioides panacisoli]|uniref:hypothetical protein n=1 Tax=Nocardioides panacisoli TaxID=627624 RepID=UPI001C62BD67|nr:hypothetical protein [Nocardioides panacisoli]QYJ05380.1 hypothetical protein KUV85_06790 [Nocardioides panacisoli]
MTSQGDYIATLPPEVRRALERVVRGIAGMSRDEKAVAHGYLQTAVAELRIATAGTDLVAPTADLLDAVHGLVVGIHAETKRSSA